MSNLKATSELIIDSLENRLGLLDNELSLGAQDRVKFAAAVMSEIAHAKLIGVDTAYHEDALKAIFANWEYEKASEISRAFWDSVDDVIGGAGAFLGSFAANAIKAAL